MDKQEKYKKSAEAFAQAQKYLPGGVDSPVRAFGGVDMGPVFIDSAQGSKIYDIDGNEYIDYVCSWGPMILGHSPKGVLEAILVGAKKGSSFGAPTVAETELAKKVIAAYDGIDKVRFVTSGTEAVMTAIRLARGYTSKDLIVKMAGCYHGHSDSLLVASGSGLAETAIASSGGVPASIANLTVVLPYNDIDAVKAAFAKHKDDIAAVLVEPVAANMGVIPPAEGYLQTIRDLCNGTDTLLIFDEVITGFRLAAGGAQEVYGINSDLTCLGKIIGGGLPAAAVGGRADIMDMLAPLGPVYQAGTLSGNPIASAAANATLDILTKGGCYQQLEASAARLEAGLSEAARSAGVDITINRVGSIMSCFFTDKPVRSFPDVQATDIESFKKYFTAMLNQGIYIAPSQFEAMFISLAHSEEDFERTLSALKTSLAN